jgi:type II restriction-modification system restriction subunit
MKLSDDLIIIKNILNNEYNIHLNEELIDGVIVKKMAKTNLLSNNKEARSNQTHIAITGNQRDLFPYIYSPLYDEEGKNNNKNFFVIKANIEIFNTNCNKFDKQKIDFKGQKSLSEEICIYHRKDNTGYQIQLSMIKNGDSSNFIKFRELIQLNDYLVIIKNKNSLSYKAFIIESKFLNLYSTRYDSFIEIENNVTTFIKSNDIIEGVSNKSKFKLWLEKIPLAEVTVRNYVKALIDLPHKFRFRDISSVYDIHDLTIIQGYEQYLGQDLEFIDYNKKNNYTPSCALKKYIEFLSEDNKNELITYKIKVDKPHQRIFFGAPGTGKSYKLNQDANQYFGNNYKRVTFHPNYMYSNFVGQYKPYPVEDNPEKITYKFVPGVLIRQIVEAFDNPDKNYLVIIEEINRANVAAVFGDLFQLLDRSNDGESEYSIAVTKELQDYFRNEAFVKSSLFEEIQNKLNDFSELYLPHNLYIWATMNSADQGVMPMDTAFKRRWEFTYLGVNDAADNNATEFENYVFEVNGKKYNWETYRREINDRLSKLNILEDKLLGPYFLSKNILINENKAYIASVLKNKVLMYLYEDAGRAFRGRLFREGSYNTYSQLCAEFDKDPLSIFKEPIEIRESSSEEP